MNRFIFYIFMSYLVIMFMYKSIYFGSPIKSRGKGLYIPKCW